ncbi:MAG: glycogen debranching protein [Candidatus Poribacteria bacterium]|nr:MAG: glycogen debranching protein [Candidatus Poribacteria bacterium]
MIYDSRFLQDLERSAWREWLETNGIGGYASGTLAGVPTRRYHALMVASLRPPTHRVVSLHSLIEGLRSSDGIAVEFSATAYADTVHPEGYRFLERFDPYPFPTWWFGLPDGTRIEKQVVAVRGENTVVLRYGLLEGPGGELYLRPRLVWRDYHHLQSATPALAQPLRKETGRLLYQPTGAIPPLVLLHGAARFQEQAFWFYRVHYWVERERGLDSIEDHWSPGELCWELSPKRPEVFLIATHDAKRASGSVAVAPELIQNERERRTRWRESVVVDEEVEPRLAEVLRLWVARSWDYLVRRGEGWTIVAGYPWFTDWGRDTFISLPGLALALGRKRIAREIIRVYASYCSQGMIPNRFPDQGEAPEYNNVDGTLWFVEAIRRYRQAVPEDPILQKEWYPLVREILDWHVRGTRYGIRVDGDGLLRAGEPGTQLTWMDAKVGDRAITPRIGKPVEVNALWYNALRTAAELAEHAGDLAAAEAYGHQAERTRSAFRARFPNRRGRGLYDVVDTPAGVDDASIRPNQIFAVSLAHRPLTRALEQEIVDLVDLHLYTPFGLRSLAPSDPNYRPRYVGGPVERDEAYHQGTVWGWLWGPYMTAYGNVHGWDSALFRARLLDGLRLLAFRREERGIGGIAEIYDGQAPHRARGCPWQAWSLAEVLRVAVEAGLIRAAAESE